LERLESLESHGGRTSAAIVITNDHHEGNEESEAAFDLSGLAAPELRKSNFHFLHRLHGDHL
jgi:hypothetical protein